MERTVHTRRKTMHIPVASLNNKYACTAVLVVVAPLLLCSSTQSKVKDWVVITSRARGKSETRPSVAGSSNIFPPVFQVSLSPPHVASHVSFPCFPTKPRNPTFLLPAKPNLAQGNGKAIVNGHRGGGRRRGGGAGDFGDGAHVAGRQAGGGGAVSRAVAAAARPAGVPPSPDRALE
jgi:hypothetical protein